MRSFMSSSRAIYSLVSRTHGAGCSTRCARSSGRFRELARVRRIGSIAGPRKGIVRDVIAPRKDDHVRFISSFLGNIVQRRRFLGCGDGEEGSYLSKVYEERRIMGYSPEQLFDVAAAVDLYHGFVPWCQRSEILKHYPDGSFDAELEIGFKFLVESYVSHVQLDRPRSIKTTAKDTGLFDHLINVWQFNPGPAPGTTELYFLVDFKFNSPLYGQVASMFFKEVVSRIVGSFSERCRLIYGPGLPVYENAYKQGA